MNRLLKVIDNVKRLDTGMAFLAVFQEPEIKQLIIELNTEGQLRMGILADGTELPHYSITSQDLFDKDDIPIQLFDTGDFYNSFKVPAVTTEVFSIFADTIKPDTDLLRFGKVIGLTEESIAVLKERVLPFLIRYVKRKILQ